SKSKRLLCKRPKRKNRSFSNDSRISTASSSLKSRRFSTPTTAPSSTSAKMPSATFVCSKSTSSSNLTSRKRSRSVSSSSRTNSPSPPPPLPLPPRLQPRQRRSPSRKKRPSALPLMSRPSARLSVRLRNSSKPSLPLLKRSRRNMRRSRRPPPRLSMPVIQKSLGFV